MKIMNHDKPTSDRHTIDSANVPAGEQLCNLGPLVAPLAMCLIDDTVFLLCPGRLLDAGVEVIVPAFATLLADPTLKMASDQRPLLGAVSLDQRHHLVILLNHKKIHGQHI